MMQKENIKAPWYVRALILLGSIAALIAGVLAWQQKPAALIAGAVAFLLLVVSAIIGHLATKRAGDNPGSQKHPSEQATSISADRSGKPRQRRWYWGLFAGLLATAAVILFVLFNEERPVRQISRDITFQIAEHQQKPGLEAYPSEQDPHHQVYLHPEVLLDGEDVRAAEVDVSEMGEPIVILFFKEESHQDLAEITGSNIGKKLAIVNRGHVLSSASITGPITQGAIAVSGMVSVLDARDFVDDLYEVE